ncbi:MAG: hydrolase [Gammaproteobacteria bacterium]|nr:hydrolase [Gammaproteobacteria bacterium]
MLCRASDSLLVLVDAQTRLSAAMPDAARERLLRNSGTLLQAATLLNIPLLVTEQYPKGLGNTEAGLAALLPAQTIPIEKTCFSCCAAAGFMDALNASGRAQVILAGMETHVCILQTALELKRAGREIFVIEDAVCSRAEGHHQNALARLRHSDVVVTNTESVLFEWLRDAAHAEFKNISHLVR